MQMSTKRKKLIDILLWNHFAYSLKIVLQHPLVELYIDCASFSPKVKISPAKGVTRFTVTYIIKLFLSENIMPGV